MFQPSFLLLHMIHFLSLTVTCIPVCLPGYRQFLCVYPRTTNRLTPTLGSLGRSGFCRWIRLVGTAGRAEKTAFLCSGGPITQPSRKTCYSCDLPFPILCT
ncbi:uncharacterized protein BP01DRAFT_120604 [Aspergillus saccharolyticus JOP 1030-1]|uniref:Secreted protein n=1 Tax=Aspergillus saccharolyticus JOP 1030-1 TaxID=1450539 RepID=A0A318ZPX5_9EURO|nr:hypothetical protein BP01DRAFT_120604 [Aspergillus saccharolyticus JOP 1030-1]PYH49077.1 hypothetical protein BP01DRAFT_120604 [Aspergillus saccharolyticus JOP 1030-1]